MKTIFVIMAAMLAASCSAQSDICTPVPKIEDGLGSIADMVKNRQDPMWLERRAAACLHRWGYRLAPSPDEGLTVAKAVMQACEGAVKQHAQAYGAQMADAMQAGVAAGVVDVVERNDYAAELTAEKMAQLEREAHFRVQTARAGKCKTPA